MAKRKPGLGRGLDSLMSNTTVPTTQAEQAVLKASGELQELPLEFLQSGQYQPRQQIDQDSLQELADSIREQGVMQPILVRPIGQNKYEIIAGERRWRASQMAQQEIIPAVVRVLDDQAAIALALIENLQREDLNPMEEAEALLRLQQEFELTQEEVAKAVGKKRATVANMLRLIKLDNKVKQQLAQGLLEMGHARALLSLEYSQQQQVANEIIKQKLNVRQAEAKVKALLNPKAVKRSVAGNTDIKRLEQELGEYLGAHIDIQHSAKGSGKLIVRYGNSDELQGIIQHIKKVRPDGLSHL